MKPMAFLQQFLRRPKVKTATWASLVLVFAHSHRGFSAPSSSNAQHIHFSPASAPSTLWPSQIMGPRTAQAPETWFGSESYVNFAAARSELVTLLKGAKERVIVVSSALTDPVIATRLHSLKLAGRTVLVLLEKASERSYNSRHLYLMKASVPVYFGPLRQVGLSAQTHFVIDNNVLSFNLPLDSSAPGKAVLSDASMTPDDLIGKINSSIALTRPRVSESAPASAAPSAAKASTSRQTVPASKNGTIRLKARAPAVPQDGTTIPRSLPKRTRGGEIQAGNLSGGEAIEPLRRPKDEFLRLDNESELRAD